MQRFSQLTASIAGMSLPQHSSSRRKGRNTTTGFSLIFDEYDQSYRYNNNYQTHYVLPTEAFIRMERERTADFSFTTHCDDEDEDEDEDDDDDDIETTLVVNDDDNTDVNNEDKDRYIVIATKDILEVTPLVERTNNTDHDDADAVDADADADDDDSCHSFDTFSSSPSAEVVRAATAVESSAPSEEEKDEQPQHQQLRASSRSHSHSHSHTSRINNKIAMTTTKSVSNLKSTIQMSLSASRRRTHSHKNATTNDKSVDTPATTELSFIVDDKDNDDKDDADDYDCYTVLPTEAFITMERVRSSDFSYDDTTTVASYYDTTSNNDENNDALISVFILDTIKVNTVKDGDGVGESESDNDEAVLSSYDQQCPYYHQESIETIDGATTNTLATTKYGDDIVRHCSFLASSALIVVSLSLSCIEFEEV